MLSTSSFKLWYNITMKVIRNHTTLKKMTKQDDSYVDASPRERISFIWQLTAELWSLKDKQPAEQRLQRNVTNLIRRGWFIYLSSPLGTPYGATFSELPYDFDMFFEVFVVDFGKISSVMNASALLSRLGGLRHKQANGKHILTFPAIGWIKDFVHHVPLPEPDNLLSLSKLLCLSGDADISPHKSSKRVSNISGV